MELEETSFLESLLKMIDDATDAQAYEALLYLQERLGCIIIENDPLNERNIWVRENVYERILDNPKGVIMHSRGKDPILVRGYVKAEEKK